MKKLFLALVMITLAACVPSTLSTPENTLVAPVTDAPTESPTAQGNGCPAETAGMKLLINEENGYCLLYSADHSVILPHLIVINPVNAPGDVPGEAWAEIVMEPASGRTAAQVADAQIAEWGEGFGITRSEILVDGQQAIVVDGLPGQDSQRKVFVVGNERLYTLAFLPWFPSNDPSQPAPLENLYATIVGTIHFLP
ncbi:MAG: hypothetical protein CNIPEHKO_03166 [Anaerolineales bacterium]|nr:hypothetical protein [Anaerolineales bacterium]